MLDDLSTVLMVARAVLLLVGVCAIAVWAARQPDEQSVLMRRQAERRNTCGEN